MKDDKIIIRPKFQEKKALFEMATLTKGDLPGLEVLVYPSDHSITSFPNFHLKCVNYEAEFKIPNAIPESPEEFEFLGYKRHKKDYSMSDLRRVIKWMSKDNKRIKNNNNLEAIKAFWSGLNPDDGRLR